MIVENLLILLMNHLLLVLERLCYTQLLRHGRVKLEHMTWVSLGGMAIVIVKEVRIFITIYA
jgi:hypothetical protein